MSTDQQPRANNGVFRTKTVEQSIRDTEEPEHALKKSLSAWDLMVFGVGVIIGTGIFVLTGKVAKENAGPATALAFIAASLWLMLNLPGETWFRFAVWMVIGIVVYFLYGRRHSRLGQEGQAAKY